MTKPAVLIWINYTLYNGPGAHDKRCSIKGV